MSTWTELEADLVTALSSYSRLADNREVEDTASSRVHLSYSLKPTGFDDRALTSNSRVGSYKVALNIIYLNTTATARATNIDLFNTIKTDIETLPKFAGYYGAVSFSDIDKKHSKATLEFYYGVLEPYEAAMTQLDNLQADVTSLKARATELERVKNNSLVSMQILQFDGQAAPSTVYEYSNLGFSITWLRIGPGHYQFDYLSTNISTSEALLPHEGKQPLMFVSPLDLSGDVFTQTYNGESTGLVLEFVDKDNNPVEYIGGASILIIVI